MSTATLIAKQATPLPKLWSLGLAVAILLVILFAPPVAGLPIAGQRMLAVFGFAVVVWVTEALDYAVSAIVIAGLMAVLLGISPDPAKPAALMGTTQGLTMAVSGFGNTALILVAAALFLAAAMSVTGLDRRIALVILSHVGTRTSRVVIGGIVITIVLSFLVPERHRTRRGGRADHARHRARIRRGEAQPPGGTGHADHGAGRQRLECRGEDRRRAEHGGHRLHPAHAGPRHHLGGLAGRGGAVLHRAVDRRSTSSPCSCCRRKAARFPAARRRSSGRWPKSDR